MKLSIDKNVQSERCTSGPNITPYPLNALPCQSSAPMDLRSGRSLYFTPRNQPSGMVNDKPPCASGSDFHSADGNSNFQSKKKSIVITNSSLSNTIQSQSLCRVEFQNTICLALPPNITWEELNASPISETDISYLLHYTTQLNSQLKKRKKRMRSYRNEDQHYRKYVDTRSYASTSTRNQLAPKVNYCELKPSISSVNRNKTNSVVTCAEKNSKLTPIKAKKTAQKAKKSESQSSKTIASNAESDGISKVGVPSSSCSTKQGSIVKSVDSTDEGINNDDNCKMRINEILKFKEHEYTNPEIIESLKKNNILSSTSPFSKGSGRSIPVPIRINNPSSSSNIPKLLDLKFVDLMQRSWTGSDNGEEGEISKEIYDNIANQVNNLDNKTADSPSSKSVKKKKKNKKEKKTVEANKTEKQQVESSKAEQTKAGEEAVEKFDDYYDDLVIQEGLKKGTMYQDILRINLKNWREAFVSCSLDDKDVFIDGLKNRNRALDGDEVVVELLPHKKLNVSEDTTQKPATQKCGKVVRIIKQNHPRTAVGLLKRVFQKKIMSIFISPIDSRVPRIKVLIDQCPEDLKLRYLKFNHMVYLAKITNWEFTQNAEGILLDVIGDEAEPNVETKCVLFENFLDITPFEPASEFIPALPYEIPAEEFSKRLDIRNSCVFTIDPPGAKDLDDALSCSILPNNNIEVGIHIADVTHFLKPDTALDRNAREKATSVYLTETVHHMLPFDLCQLCSLTPGDDKLAFSVFVELDEDANVVSHKFIKTVIRSCVQLTYAHAQDVIKNYSESYEPESFPPVTNDFTAKDCVHKICCLQKLASKMRKRRFVGGALKIDQPKIIFSLDEDRLPCSFSLYEGQECNWLIEEFMLLANILAANKMRKSFPEIALLRFHAAPKEKSLSSAVEFLEKVGIFIDTTDAGSVYESMMQYEGFDEIGKARMAVITNFLVKPMMKALYVCASKNNERLTGFWHYALNTPCYTHFTSPIRRYADVVVHRLLAASIGYEEVPQYTPDEIQEIAVNCNIKKNSSKRASETSTELYLKLYLERCGSLKVRAVVIDVRERNFEFIDLTTRTINRIMVNKIQGAEKVEFEDQNMPSLKVTWKNDLETFEQIIQIFTIIDVELSFKKNSGQRLLNKINVELLKPET